MKTKIIKSALVAIFLSFSLYAFPQCNILNKVSPDGSMQYYMEPVNFYTTKTKSLTGCVVTDMENYFLEMFPVPFPDKSEGKKIKTDLVLKLSDGTVFNLKHYDTRYLKNDSVMALLYLIGKDDIEKLTQFEVSEAKFDLKGDEGIRTYVFKLHKQALKEQLNCFLNEDEEDKKK